jgi:hypothetical protein
MRLFVRRIHFVYEFETSMITMSRTYERHSTMATSRCWTKTIIGVAETIYHQRTNMIDCEN